MQNQERKYNEAKGENRMFKMTDYLQFTNPFIEFIVTFSKHVGHHYKSLVLVGKMLAHDA